MGVGDLKLPDRLGRINDPANHFFLREVELGSIDRLKALNLREAGYPTLSTRRLTKDQIVAAYIAAYSSAEPAAFGDANAFGEPEKADDEIVILRPPVKMTDALEAVAEVIEGSPTKRDCKPGPKPLPGDRLVICGGEATGWQVRRIASTEFRTLRHTGVEPGLNVGHPASAMWPTRAGAEVAAKRQAKRLGVPWDTTE